MGISSHPSVEELREVVRGRGGNVACTICGHEDFAMEEVAPTDARGGYGQHRLQRADLVCKNCGHVMGFELARLQ